MGEVTEWLKVLVSKTSVPLSRYRGFESRPLRHFLQANCLVFTALFPVIHGDEDGYYAQNDHQPCEQVTD